MTIFEQLIENAPQSVKDKLEGLKGLRERPDFHPEASTFEHIRIVTERLIQTGDRDLIMTGFFHDLFKLDTMVMHQVTIDGELVDVPSSPGHEHEAEKFINQNEDVKAFIWEVGRANPDTVAFLCGQHMRVKHMGEMNIKKRSKILLLDEAMLEKVVTFTVADRMLFDWDKIWSEWGNKDHVLIGDVTYAWIKEKIEEGKIWKKGNNEKDKIVNKMSLHKISGKDLLKLGYKQGPVISVAMQVAEKHYKHTSLEDMLAIFKGVLENPAEYLEDSEKLGKVSDFLIPKPKAGKGTEFKLVERKDYNVYGADKIEEGAIDQMNTAMSLPVTIAGALMPDAHAGYGLPIGGVLATEGAIIPYAVGVDISCSMWLTIFDIPGKDVVKNVAQYKKNLVDNTLFGTGQGFDEFREHPVMERAEFNTLTILKNMKDKAAHQLGSSGTGNHFVEFGVVTIDGSLGVPAGEYLALLSHSGSRGLGANVAGYYTKLAMEKCILPKDAKNLAWLDLNSQEGQEYWIAMNLAGDYALACHQTIHEKIAKAIKAEPLVTIKNSHNLAWKEMVDGKELIVHRKGATPAGLGVLGIIPGSMTAPGFIVRGKGSEKSLQSASHGAGRQMSRTVAKNSITNSAMNQLLADNNITLVGAGLDEAPQAYKDIHGVMAAQADLVEVVGTFQPKIVRMADEEAKKW